MISNDIQGVVGSVYRLYQAAFGRIPDGTGLSSNVGAAMRGLSLRDLAAGFVSSDEFLNKYGRNSTDTAFVTALYRNVLNRAPDAAGLADWLNRLRTNGGDRGAVLIGFSESPENHQKVDPSLAGGIALDDRRLAGGFLLVGDGIEQAFRVPEEHNAQIIFGATNGEIASSFVERTVTGGIANITTERPSSGYWGRMTQLGTASTSRSLMTIQNFQVQGPNHDALQFQVSAWETAVTGGTGTKSGALGSGGTAYNSMMVNGDGTQHVVAIEPQSANAESVLFTVANNTTLLPNSAQNAHLVVVDTIRRFTDASDLAASLNSAAGALNFSGAGIARSGVDGSAQLVNGSHILVAYADTEGFARIADVDIINGSAGAINNTAQAGVSVFASDMVRLQNVSLSALQNADIVFASQMHSA